jgi:hypothetical protein
MASRTARRCNPFHAWRNHGCDVGIAAVMQETGAAKTPILSSSVKIGIGLVVFRLNLERFHPIYWTGGYIAVF